MASSQMITASGCLRVSGPALSAAMLENGEVQMATSAFEEFRVGSVIGRGLSILFRNFAAFMALGLIIMLPMLVLSLWAASGGMPAQSTSQPMLFDAVYGVLNLLLTNLVTAAVVYGTFRELKGERAGFGECLSTGLGRLLPVLGVAIVAGIAIVLGLVLLIVPGLIALTMFYVAVPVAVVERPGVLESLQRSSRLTQGYRWRVFGLIVLIAIGISVFSIVTGIFFGVLLAGAASTAAAALFEWVISAFLGCVVAVISAVAYHDLRVVKEGIDIHQMAAVFD